MTFGLGNRCSIRLSYGTFEDDAPSRVRDEQILVARRFHMDDRVAINDPLAGPCSKAVRSRRPVGPLSWNPRQSDLTCNVSTGKYRYQARRSELAANGSGLLKSSRRVCRQGSRQRSVTYIACSVRLIPARSQIEWAPENATLGRDELDRHSNVCVIISIGAEQWMSDSSV